VGEAVHRAAVDDQLEVGPGLVHLFDESRHLCGWDVRIQSAVADEHLGLDRARTGRVSRLEASVNADRAGQVRSGSRELGIPVAGGPSAPEGRQCSGPH
jgi:hypothetical protein